MLSEMLRRCGMKRIESWLNTRILQLRQRIQDLREPREERVYCAPLNRGLSGSPRWSANAFSSTAKRRKKRQHGSRFRGARSSVSLLFRLAIQRRLKRRRALRTDNEVQMP